MKPNPIYKAMFMALICSSSYGQVSFTNASSNLSNNTAYSGCAMAVADMNGDGLDDIVRFSNARNLRIDYQTPSGTFTGYSGSSHGGSVWGMTLADIDENGYLDILAGGAYNNISRYSANGSGTSYTRSDLGGPPIFVQNLNFADINNDGSIDFFACHDDGVSSPYQNNGAGGLTHTASLINTASTVPSDNSGNYGSVWTDYDNDGDLDLYISKCRLGVLDPLDGRRLNLLFQNDGSNNFSEIAPAAGLQPQRQSWAMVFGDLDNDGDQDGVLLNHDGPSIIYRNNGNGTFTDITASSGVATEVANINLGIQVIMADFDNDTYLDFLCTTRSGTHYIFYNDGDMTFTPSSPFFSGTKDIQSGAAGDLNNDGFVDIIAGFANSYNSAESSRPDRLYLNNGNSNHWSKIKLTGVQSNRDAIGAKVIIEGAWGQQLREIRAGDSYGTQNSLAAYFGLGSSTEITKIRVEWPSGIIDELLNPGIDQLVEIQEGETCQTLTVWDGSSWDNGLPSNTKKAAIAGNYNTLTNGDIEACILEIRNAATLTIGANSYANIKKDLMVLSGGTLNILDDGSLVQQEDNSQSVNQGTIRVFKETPALNNRDFMIVGSPSSRSTQDGVFASAIQFRNHITANFNAHPGVTILDGLALNFADAEGDNWQVYTRDLNIGEGYLVMPQRFATVPDGETYVFQFNEGSLNNGLINVPVVFGDDANDSPNILSNPYASAIYADAWLMENEDIATTIYLWDHATSPSTSYPGYNEANYDMGDISTYNVGTGGVAGNGGIVPDGFLASGQGFAIKAAMAGNAVFNNSMRVNGNNTGFRSSSSREIYRDRIWLNVESTGYGLKSQALIGFIEGASQAFEPFYDVKRIASPVSLYSKLATGEELSIQGLGSFDLDKEVSLGFRTQVDESELYSISLGAVERHLMTEDTQIYLKDHYLGTITNLSEVNYSFSAEAGNFTDRFTLFFKERTLGTYSVNPSQFVMYPNPAKEQITIDFGPNTPCTVMVYDLSGRLILQQAPTNGSMIQINTSRLQTGIYYVKANNNTLKLVIK